MEAAVIAENVYSGTKGDELLGGWKMLEDPYAVGGLRMGVYGGEGADGRMEYVVANAVLTNKNAMLFNPATVFLEAYGLKKSKYTAEMTAYIVEDKILNNIFGFISIPIDKAVYLPTQHLADTLGEENMDRLLIVKN